ncbi:serine/threonine-protein kinase [Novipirellula artificiosorum]|uniref:Serine/threonine-protein kinase PknB n=1 Tax=Novipirellula artificiosorum TaxID=2528016 RepID=A0A5C6DYL4_9BACT|nr:serine/threonine-protein kinase [Novipirellula artificiosorum]TWU41728.1 Serine/threonine-protein kinase PknB [Novipirellula artificiosorum]
MSSLTPEQFILRIKDLGLADIRAVDRVRSEHGAGNHSLAATIESMQRAGIVTTLQTEKILRGDRSGYYYGEYKVLYLIGAGTFARVYRASKDDKVFAVKVLRKRFRDEPKELEQFLREGRMGLKLRHPNIVSIYDVVPDIRHPFLVMEFVEGQTLRELVKVRGKLPADLALKLIYDVCSGLSHAAQLGISHRDLKLSNVLISTDGKAKLVDFGLAALADRNNPDVVADCPNARAIDYAALERGTGVRKDDPRSDVFFAGNMLYHMLAGTPALIETRDRLARLNVNRFIDITPLPSLVPDVPGVANQIVQKSMRYNVNERFQSAGEMQAEIKKAITLLERGDVGSAGGDYHQPMAEHHDDDELPSNEGEGYVVMFVESKATLQNAVRDRLKARGYRVLVIQDPDRALSRFAAGEERPADAVIFGASDLGSAAIEAHNRFAEEEATRDIPTVLLIDRKQTHLIAAATRGPNRKMLGLPLKVRELRTALALVLADVPRRQIGTF